MVRAGWRVIRSIVKAVWIEIVRSGDHTWRQISGGPRAKRSLITPQLYLGGQYKLRGLKRLKEWGVTGVVNMRLKDFKRAEDAEWLDYLHLPTPDNHPPKMEDLEKGVEFIAKIIKSGGKVYVHCRFGEGRGPSMMAAYLMADGLRLTEALEVIQKVRPFARPTKSQMKRLKEFELKVKKSEGLGQE